LVASGIAVAAHRHGYTIAGKVCGDLFVTNGCSVSGLHGAPRLIAATFPRNVCLRAWHGFRILHFPN
jgi:hypothetical protein